MQITYLMPTQRAGFNLINRKITGKIVMLNLLRFRDIADYSDYPDLMSDQLISGESAYQKYITHTLPFLRESGGEVLFYGKGGDFLIGPSDEKWDIAMLVQQ